MLNVSMSRMISTGESGLGETPPSSRKERIFFDPPVVNQSKVFGSETGDWSSRVIGHQYVEVDETFCLAKHDCRTLIRSPNL